MGAMEFNLEEIYIQSIMTKIATVIVEGVDDVPVYDSICSHLNKKYDVIAVENIDNFAEGSVGVIQAMEKISFMPSCSHIPKSYILGIIDKDVRDYRNEVPQNDLVFMLNQYSMESHFVSEEALKGIINRSIKATSNLKDEKLNEFIFQKVQESISELYLYSLEALKGATDSTYDSDFSYSYKYGRIKDPVIKQKMDIKKTPLMTYAHSLGITECINSLKKISKGKWLLSYFCEQLEKIFQNLPSDCNNSHIEKCQFCINEALNKCQYKLKEGITHITIKSFALEEVEGAELNYIRSRLEIMLPSNLAA
jgi:hypothetical protein